MIGSRGANTESGRISQIQQRAAQCAIAEGLRRANQGYCKPLASIATPMSESVYLRNIQSCILSAGNNSNTDTSIGPTTESIRISRIQGTALDCAPRFSEYNRWNPLPACPPLPAEANSAGQPKPSLNTCLPNKNATTVSF